MLSIGTLSRRCGVKVPTIRYYEEIGLLPQPERSSGGQRRYTPAQAERLGFIRHSRDLGFPLDAIRALLDIADHPDQSCAEANALAQAQLSDVRKRIERLQRLEAELTRIASACDGGAEDNCDVLAALGDHGKCTGHH